jgi:hypothetical protein
MGGFAGLGSVIHQLSVPFTLIAANHHVGKKHHAKKHHTKKHHTKKHHTKKHHRKMRGGTRRRAKGGMGFGDYANKMRDHANKMRDKLDSRENKFIKKMGEATEIVNNQSVPFPKGSKNPFQLKVKEVADLVARNAGIKANVWQRKRTGDIAEAIAKFKEAMDKKSKLFPKTLRKKDGTPDESSARTLKDDTKDTISLWVKPNEYGMQWAYN